MHLAHSSAPIRVFHPSAITVITPRQSSSRHWRDSGRLFIRALHLMHSSEPIGIFHPVRPQTICVIALRKALKSRTRIQEPVASRNIPTVRRSDLAKRPIAQNPEPGTWNLEPGTPATDRRHCEESRRERDDAAIPVLRAVISSQ